jgi:hypothetical protein
MKVVVAGRVWTSLEFMDDDVWPVVWLLPDVFVPLAVCADDPVVGACGEVWAAATDATVSVNAAAIVTRFNIRTSASNSHTFPGPGTFPRDPSGAIR